VSDGRAAETRVEGAGEETQDDLIRKEAIMQSAGSGNVVDGKVRWSPAKSLWWTAMAATALVGGPLTFRWDAVALFLALTGAVLLFGHSLGSHRKLIHDSFACPTWLEYLLVYAGVQVGLCGPLGILAQHDLRDHAQRQQDCHDYLRHGKTFWVDGWWQLHCELTLDEPPVLPIPEHIAEDKFYAFLERTWMLQQLPPAILLYLAGGWAFVVWGVCARITAGVTGHWLIGYAAHNHGAMHYTVDGAAVQGRNVRLASLLTMGESWHNNHHAYPGSARLGLFAGEWDPGWWVLKLLERYGLAWGFRLPHDCPPRAALRTLDDMQPVLAHPVARTPGLPPAAMLRAILSTSRQLLARRRPLALEGPCVALSPRGMRYLAGNRATLTRSPSQARLRLTYENTTVSGLPALVIAIGSRSPIAAVLALAMLPFATLCELVRSVWPA
jgi:fatty-acid desaturase